MPARDADRNGEIPLRDRAAPDFVAAPALPHERTPGGAQQVTQRPVEGRRHSRRLRFAQSVNLNENRIGIDARMIVWREVEGHQRNFPHQAVERRIVGGRRNFVAASAPHRSLSVPDRRNSENYRFGHFRSGAIPMNRNPHHGRGAFARNAMNEAETRAELIDPALRAAGWGVVADSRVRRETICPGRIEGAGRRGKPEIADYVLTFRNHKLAVIEAKARDKGDTEGVGQAKAYAEKLQARFAFSTNGRRIYRIDMETGKEGYVERYPTPDELWAEVFKTPNEWRDRFAAVPFEERGGTWQTRYYQHNAIENALEAIAAGKQRILLTLATGTGKTAIAFQIAWALFQSRWNLSRKPERRPRILFLADRNILADQAYNAFSAFPEDALARIKPDEIRKKGRVPKNASVFFTIFQTFMSGTGRGRQAVALFRRVPEGLLRLHRHRRVPSRRRQRRKQLARHSRIFLAGRSARPDRDAEADAITSIPTPISASRFTPIR